MRSLSGANGIERSAQRRDALGQSPKPTSLLCEAVAFEAVTFEPLLTVKLPRDWSMLAT